MHEQRLMQLMEHLRNGKLGHDEFNFRSYSSNIKKHNPNCGTCGCALGECPTLWPDDWLMMHHVPVLRDAGFCGAQSSASNWFELRISDVHHLFYPSSQDVDAYGGGVLSGNATRYEVADNIEAFIAKMKDDQS